MPALAWGKCGGKSIPPSGKKFYLLGGELHGQAAAAWTPREAGKGAGGESCWACSVACPLLEKKGLNAVIYRGATRKRWPLSEAVSSVTSGARGAASLEEF